jgi:cytidylate kinase
MTQKKSNIVICVGGPGGSGSTTISKMLAKHFKLKHIYAGDLFRKEAKQEDIENFEQFLEEISKGGNSLDLEIDNMLVEYAKKGNVLIESKIFGALAKEKNIKCDISIWLTASKSTRVKRHLGKENVKGIKKIFKYFDILRRLKKRYRIDREKYWRLYKVKYEKPSLYYDIVIDSSNIDENETFNLILKKIEDGGYIKQ